jgi:hypothetical protein
VMCDTNFPHGWTIVIARCAKRAVAIQLDCFAARRAGHLAKTV